MLSTDDGGLTWREHDFGAVDVSQMSFVSPTDGWMFVSFRGPDDFGRSDVERLMQTDDGGRTWTTVTLPSIPGCCQRIQRLDSERAIADNLLTADGGATWRRIDPPCSEHAEKRASSRGGSVWVLCQWGAGGGNASQRLYASPDAGRTWEMLGEHLWAPATPTAGVPRLGPGYVAGFWFVDERRGWLIHGGHTSGASLTVDGGRTWSRITLGTKADGTPRTYFVSGVGVLDLGEGWVLISADAELWSSEDYGVTWHRVPGPPPD
jgi:photosystem II stability/assembly factor-like uncharacterized protein